MKFLIEKATINNLDEILNLFKTTIETSCSKDYTEAQIYAWTSSIENKDRWKNKIENQYFIVAKHHHKITGFGSLENDYLDFLFVDKDYLRNGIASLIYDKLKEKAKDLGFIKLTTYASITAKPFFESKGFYSIKKNKIVRKGIEITNFEMTQ